MKILFDLQHPAHLHFFRNAVAILEKQGHEILITGREKDILSDLAREYGVQIQLFGTAKKGILNLGRELLYRQWHLFKIIRRFRPDLIMAVAGTFVSLPGKLNRIPVYIFYDTEHATVSNLLAYPFAKCIYIPQCYRKKIRRRHVRYNGYHELAYLNPNYFRPDPSVLENVGVQPGEIFSLLRFVNWGAGHDIGLSGFTSQNKIRAVREFSRFGKVFISSEEELPSQLEPFRLRLPVGRIHHLMAYAALIFGESATMASEGAVLGVPGVYVDPIGRGYTDEQEKEYGIVFNFETIRQEGAIQKGIDILENYNRQRDKWKDVHQRIIREKIDVTQIILDIVNGKDNPRPG